MPSKETVDKALAAINEPAAYEYFFDQLNSPSWINPLKERGFFQNPPSEEIEGNYVRFPPWPESRYLARVASLAPELVLDVIKDIPETTNSRILGDLVDALIAMPAALSARLVRRAGSWITSRYALLLPQKLGELVVCLTRGGQLEAGFTLAYELLAPADVSADEEPGGLKLVLSGPQPRYEMWSYEQVARKVIPVLAEVDNKKARELLSELLENAVRLTAPGAEPPHDASGIWRSTVEDGSQNDLVESMRDVLIMLLRDTAYKCADPEPADLSGVAAELLDRPWRIFHRIAYHLLASRVDANLGLARQLVLDRSHFDDLDEYHEFWLLARAIFPWMSQGEQQELLGLLEAGPAEIHGDDPEHYRQAWRLRRLAVLKDVLGPDTLQKYNALSAALGYEPERPDLLRSPSDMWNGPTSPKEVDELRSMTTQEIVAFLNTWQPSGEFMGPSREGLTRNLSAAVAAEPRRFAESAADMTELNPTYLRGLIDGWTVAAKEGRPFPWPHLLRFCLRTIEGQHGSGDAIEESSNISEWQLARRSIAHLLGHAFSQNDCQVPLGLRTHVWAILERLASDAEPTPEFEERYGGSNMDPASLAINTTRGQAMHDVVRYALWVARTISEGGKQPDTVIGFDLIPEARRVLTEHLKLSLEPSAAVRSVYGQWLPWLYSLGQEWTKDNLSSIFPDAARLAYLRNAAWNSYLFFSPLSDYVFDLLGKQYAEAVMRLPEPAEGSIRPEAPGVRLGQHIIIQFLRGRLSLDSSLVIRFFKLAALDIRKETLSHAGRILKDLATRDVTAVERAIELWNWRAAAQTDRNDTELTAFGWWFPDEALPVEWAFEQLIQTLDYTNGRIDNDYGIMIRLAEIADADPVQAVRCLRALVEREHERGIILASVDKVSDILRVALASEQPSARQSAIDLIHLLGAHGYREMRRLLSATE